MEASAEFGSLLACLGVIIDLFYSTFWFLSNVKGTKHTGKALIFIIFIKLSKILFQVRIKLKCWKLNLFLTSILP